MRDYQDWTNDAACNGMETNLFFPIAAKKSTRDVRKLCDEVCPVRVDCIQHAVIYNEDGIWGGRTKNFRTRHYSSALRALLIIEAKKAGVYHKEFTRENR